MPEWNAQFDSPVFERRLAGLLSEYATAADQPFDADTIVDLAAGATPRLAPWSGRIRLFGPSVRAAWVLVLLLGLVAALVGGAIVLDTPSPAPRAPAFAPDELLFTDDRGQIVAVNVSTGERWVVAEGGLLAVSPDRTRLVRVPEEGTSLILTDASGTDLGQIPSEAFLATWSPDGRYVAFVQPGVGPYGRYTVWDTSTGVVTQLGIDGFPNGGNFPSWAPDSQHVLLTTDHGLVIADLDGDVVRAIPETGLSSYGYWSPDGAHILHEKSQDYLELLEVNPDFSTEVVSRFEPYFTNPSWSPDGRMVAGVSVENQGTGAAEARRGGGITVVSLEDAGQPRVVFPRERLLHPTLGSEWTVEAQDVKWSPDGRRIAFVAWDPIAEEPALFAADPVGGGATVMMRISDWAVVDW